MPDMDMSSFVTVRLTSFLRERVIPSHEQQ